MSVKRQTYHITEPSIIAGFIKRAFLVLVLFGFGLIILGWYLEPGINVLSITAIISILICYAVSGYFIFPKVQTMIINVAGLFGLLAGIIFAGEILLEYAVLPADNTIWGIVEFSSVFTLIFFSGMVSFIRTNSIKNGMISAVLSSLISSITWLIFALTTFYIFRGTFRQEMVFTAEGNLVDFARSGMKDFNTFIMEDFFGAGFFHLLLSPVIAAFLGMVSSWIGKSIVQLTRQ